MTTGDFNWASWRLVVVTRDSFDEGWKIVWESAEKMAQRILLLTDEAKEQLQIPTTDFYNAAFTLSDENALKRLWEVQERRRIQGNLRDFGSEESPMQRLERVLRELRDCWAQKHLHSTACEVPLVRIHNHEWRFQEREVISGMLVLDWHKVPNPNGLEPPRIIDRITVTPVCSDCEHNPGAPWREGVKVMEAATFICPSCAHDHGLDELAAVKLRARRAARSIKTSRTPKPGSKPPKFLEKPFECRQGLADPRKVLPSLKPPKDPYVIRRRMLETVGVETAERPSTPGAPDPVEAIWEAWSTATWDDP